MKTRFLNEGLDSFSAHEVIELLLFYAIPQRNVNETAHKLIERFGSLAGVLEADIEDLESVDGVGTHAAVMIKLMSALTRRYAMERNGAELRYTSAQQIGNYLVSLFIGVTVECAYLLLFDNSMKLLEVVSVGSGAVDSVGISPRLVAEKALKREASVVVLAHNHPNGTTIPSREDVAVTAMVKNALDVCNITLLDHFIISGKFFNVMIGAKNNDAILHSSIDIDPEDFYKDVDSD